MIETLIGIIGLTGLERGTKLNCLAVDGEISNYMGVGPSYTKNKIIHIAQFADIIINY